MIPVHFGRSQRQLFGVYTPAAEPRARRGVVICNPWGMEALRAHRALRHLGELLSKNGLDVMRFDYSGTGDSFGSASSARLADWVEDAELALDELIALAGVRRATMLGLRLGSYVAAQAAAHRPDDVDRAVLWEPVFQGAEHVAELLDGAGAGRARGLSVVGFPLPPAFRDDLAKASLNGLPGPRIRVQLVSSTQASNGASGVSARDVTKTRVEAEPCWVEEGQFGAGAVPVELLSRIVEWLK